MVHSTHDLCKVMVLHGQQPQVKLDRFAPTARACHSGFNVCLQNLQEAPIQLKVQKATRSFAKSSIALLRLLQDLCRDDRVLCFHIQPKGLPHIHHPSLLEVHVSHQEHHLQKKQSQELRNPLLSPSEISLKMLLLPHQQELLRRHGALEANQCLLATQLESYHHQAMTKQQLAM